MGLNCLVGGCVCVCFFCLCMVVCGIFLGGIKLSGWWLCVCFVYLCMVVCGMVLGGIKMFDTQPFQIQPFHTH